MSKYLTEMEARSLISCIKQHTPVVTGNLKASIQFVRMTTDGFVVAVGIKKTGMSGASPSAYASFVNYGHEIYPKSKKLRRDYKFVEHGIQQWADEIKRTVDYKMRFEKKGNDE